MTEHNIPCKHPIPQDIEFLLKQVGNQYKTKDENDNQTTLLQKWKKYRKCTEGTLCRDEIYEIFKSLKVSCPDKKADDLFFRANQDADATLSCSEFIDMYR